MTFSLGNLLKDSAYKLDQFTPQQMGALEASVTLKDAAKKPAPYVTCLVRGKPIKLTPEEAIRQLYVMALRDELGYLHNRSAIPDNHVTVLRPKKGLDAIYLSVFLNSKAGQWQVEQRLRGSSGQIELYPGDIAQFKIWVAPTDILAKIRKSVETSFEQRQRAAQSADAAKHAVEIAIEDSEAAALSYLDEISPQAN